MVLDAIAEALRTGRRDVNLRPYLRALVEGAQGSLALFRPLPRGSESENLIQVLDLFSGAGGMSLGFAAVNAAVPAYRHLGGCDLDPVSARTYADNFGTPVLNGDVTRLASDPASLESLLGTVGFDPDLRTVLVGCAPCQGFSSHRKRHWNEDEDERNDLVASFAEVVGKVEPDVILMENVPEFLSGRYWTHYSKARDSFERMGYTVKGTIYDAAGFGVPQERFRSIIVGMHGNFALPSEYLSPSEFRTVRDAIADLPPVEPGVPHPSDPMHRSASHRRGTLDVIREVPRDGGSRPVGVGPAYLDRTKGFSDVYGRLRWDRPSITITHYARNPASGRFVHPEQDRGLTAREAARLQSFPDGFEFSGGFDDVFRQIGEAVPPMLSAAIAAGVLVELVSAPPTPEDLSGGPETVDGPVSDSYSSVIAGIKTRDRT